MLDWTKPYSERCGVLENRIKYEQDGKFFDSSGLEIDTVDQPDVVMEKKPRGRPGRKAKE